MFQSKETSQEITAQHATDVSKQVQLIGEELSQTTSNTHPEYLNLLETLEETRERLKKLANMQYNLSLQHAEKLYHFTLQQIENDYQLGREDVKEKIYAKLRGKKKELRDILDKISVRGVQCQELINSVNELKIPNKKRDKRSLANGPAAFKATPEDIRSDIQAIKEEAEKREGLKK